MMIKLNREEELLIKSLLKSHKADNPHISEIWNVTTSILNKIAEAGVVPSKRQPKQLMNKQYMFTFEGGGWNTVWAKTKRGAIKKAMAREFWKGSEGLTPRLDSFHVATEAGLKSAMSLFY
jgi:hypothetical protein